MKLYFSPGACSLAPHIVARESGIEIELEKVDTKAKTTASGRDYLAINPKGYVPAVELDDGEVLTEGPAIVQFLADRKPEAELAPPAGTMARYRLQEMLGFINSELHKAYSPLFDPACTPELRKNRLEHLHKRYAVLEQRLSERPHLVGDRFTVADAYLFTVTSWAAFVKLDLSPFPHVLAFQQRVAERPAVRAALAAEGLKS
ncbi:MAG TPA: glutathione transferase GstA [Nannocystaceae bacterium]|nr:glutathione transferase GstA [Nannocystaceae bacterium]